MNSDSPSLNNPKIRADINLRLGHELNCVVLSPIEGIQKIRKVLVSYGISIPVLYNLQPEGDEVVIEVDQYGKFLDNIVDPNDSPYYLYILYHLSDIGTYEFYSEVVDEERLSEMEAEDSDLIDDV